MSPQKRERPALAGTGTLENQPNNTAANNRKHTGKQAALVSDPRFRRRVEAFWPLGSRIAAELLARLAAEHDCRTAIERFLDAAIEHEQAIKAFGLDRWPGAAP